MVLVGSWSQNRARPEVHDDPPFGFCTVGAGGPRKSWPEGSEAMAQGDWVASSLHSSPAWATASPWSGCSSCCQRGGRSTTLALGVHTRKHPQVHLHCRPDGCLLMFCLAPVQAAVLIPAGCLQTRTGDGKICEGRKHVKAGAWQ